MATQEIKLDEYRAVAIKLDSELTLYSRRKKVLNRQFPYMVPALRGLPAGLEGQSEQSFGAARRVALRLRRTGGNLVRAPSDLSVFLLRLSSSTLCPSRSCCL